MDLDPITMGQDQIITDLDPIITIIDQDPIITDLHKIRITITHKKIPSKFEGIFLTTF
jgi:hypothetical protein